MSHSNFGLLLWRSRSQHDLSAKSCSAHNLVIWSQISQLFYIIDHHIDTTVARTRTLLFAVGFYNYFWQTISLCPIPIRGALPGSDRLLFCQLRESTLCEMLHVCVAAMCEQFNFLIGPSSALTGRLLISQLENWLRIANVDLSASNFQLYYAIPKSLHKYLSPGYFDAHLISFTITILCHS